MNNNKKNNTGYSELAIGMCIGVAIGTAIGATTHNMGLWISMGVSLGLCFGLLFSKKSEENETDDKKQPYKFQFAEEKHMKKNNEVYRDEQFVLGWEDDIPYLKVGGEKYKLTGHPYEPCLYITDENGQLTVVHNSFYAYDVLDLFYDGHTVTSITGFEYNAKDFCRMVEYTVGKCDVSIGDAEKVFGDWKRKKVVGEPNTLKEKSFDIEKATARESGTVIGNDLFYDIYREYPDSVIDYCIIKNNECYCGYETHRGVLKAACIKLFYNVDGELEWQYDIEKAEAKKITADELFATGNEKLTYRSAFLKPPYPNGYKNADFDRVNDALFPNGRDAIEIYEKQTELIN